MRNLLRCGSRRASKKGKAGFVDLATREGRLARARSTICSMCGAGLEMVQEAGRSVRDIIPRFVNFLAATRLQGLPRVGWTRDGGEEGISFF